MGDELPHLQLTLWGVFAYYFARGKPQEAHEVATLLVELGARQGSRELLSLGHRMMATDFFTWGQMPQALQHVELALEYSDFDLETHRLLAIQHWVNPRASALAYGSVILSVLGREEEAERFAREGMEMAGRIGHPHTTAFVLTYCALGGQLRGDARMTLALAEQCIPLAREQKFGLWFLWPSGLKAWALSELGRPQEGLVLMRQVLEQWKRSGLLAGMNYNLGLLAHSTCGWDRRRWGWPRWTRP